LVDDKKRVMLNIRLDSEKFNMLESRRKAGWGYAQTDRNRSDVYNEMIGLGLQTDQLRRELGEHTFSKVWSLLNDQNIPWEKLVEVIPKVNWDRLNLEKINKMLG
jgi:hypothetical protein